jgi:hypothetical protein
VGRQAGRQTSKSGNQAGTGHRNKVSRLSRLSGWKPGHTGRLNGEVGRRRLSGRRRRGQVQNCVLVCCWELGSLDLWISGEAPTCRDFSDGDDVAARASRARAWDWDWDWAGLGWIFIRWVGCVALPWCQLPVDKRGGTRGRSTTDGMDASSDFSPARNPALPSLLQAVLYGARQAQLGLTFCVPCLV